MAVTRSQKYRMIELDEIKYEKLSSQALESLTEYLEDLGDQMVDNEEFDIEYSQGVLTLRTGNAGAGVYVLNKQPPNKQIWLSSPISGPERYDYDASHDAWFCRHTDQSLGQLLKSELTEIFGQDIEIPIN
ncbi:Mitochondrial matrix iron chaperone [Mycoemilia scoparia]|uniref:ferroxidase n=1 Tax=Mycoemilia scoparia TaxID=417184 RepID=A0A9W7ZUD5_9FUNG|nr:Mitochondrial matrix iron chaperone [Mycoemilia scoparia]